MPQTSAENSLPQSLATLLSRSLELKMDPDHLLVLFSLLALLGILRLLETRPLAQPSTVPDLSALTSLLTSKGKGGGDLMASLARNPALLNMLLNLLTGSQERENKQRGDKGDLVALPSK